MKIAPDWFGPAGIGCAAADDMQVQLRDQIADRGKVDFCAVEMVFYETCQRRTFSHDPVALQGGNLKEISSADFRDEYEPRDQRIFM